MPRKSLETKLLSPFCFSLEIVLSLAKFLVTMLRSIYPPFAEKRYDNNIATCTASFVEWIKQYYYDPRLEIL